VARVDVTEALSRIKRVRAALRLAMPRVLEQAIRAGYEQHLAETRALSTFFVGERYIRNENSRQLGPITPKWQRRKIALGKSPNLGVFTGTLLRAISHRFSSPRTRTGWRYDIRLSGSLTGSYRTVGHTIRRRYGVKLKTPTVIPSRKVTTHLEDYVEDYVSTHAPGLGELLPGAAARIDRVVVAKAREELTSALARTGVMAEGGRLVLHLPLKVTR
jgi:hypothetical protein